VLSVLGLEHKAANDTIEVLNKVDLLIKNQELNNGDDALSQFNAHDPSKLYISAVTGQGINAVYDAIDKEIAKGEVQINLTLDVSEGQKLAWLHEHGTLLSKQQKGETIKLQVSISEKNLGAFNKLYPE
jgi:GTP-binding protein HflX